MPIITPVQLSTEVVSADLPIAGGTAIVGGATDTIVYPREGKLLIQMNNTFAGAKTITVESGDMISSGQGDLVMDFVQDDVKFIVVNSSRHVSDGQIISLTYAAAMTGFVQAVYMPND